MSEHQEYPSDAAKTGPERAPLKFEKREVTALEKAKMKLFIELSRIETRARELNEEILKTEPTWKVLPDLDKNILAMINDLDHILSGQEKKLLKESGEFETDSKRNIVMFDYPASNETIFFGWEWTGDDKNPRIRAWETMD